MKRRLYLMNTYYASDGDPEEALIMATSEAEARKIASEEFADESNAYSWAEDATRYTSCIEIGAAIENVTRSILMIKRAPILE